MGSVPIFCLPALPRPLQTISSCFVQKTQREELDSNILTLGSFALTVPSLLPGFLPTSQPWVIRQLQKLMMVYAFQLSNKVQPAWTEEPRHKTHFQAIVHEAMIKLNLLMFVLPGAE